MAEDPSLSRILKRIARKMLADFDSSSLPKHSPSKGAVREDYVRDFLSDYLPRTVEVVGTGELMTPSGKTSNQCDVMVLDAEAPPLWVERSYRIAPIEACYATIEIKSKLNSKDLEIAWDAANCVKGLPRTAHRKNLSGISYQLTANGSAVNSLPPQVHLFAYESVSMQTVGKKLHELAQRDGDPALGIDSIYLLDQGVVTWTNPGSDLVGERMPNSQIGAWESEPEQVLLWMLLHMNQRLAQAVAANPRFDLKGYVDEPLGHLCGWWPELPKGLLDELRSRAGQGT